MVFLEETSSYELPKKRPRRSVQPIERFGYEIYADRRPETRQNVNSWRATNYRRNGRRRKTRNRSKRTSISSTSSRTRTRSRSAVIEEERILELCDLSEEVLLLILEQVSAPGLINLSKTSTQFHRLCLLDTIWKKRLQVDYGLLTRWPEFSYLYLYEMFYKADELRHDQNFFKPVSQLKTSVIVWYLFSAEPPCHVVSHLTASQVKSIWGITEEELEEMYFDDSADDRPEMFPLCHYEWTKLYHVFRRKHGGLRQMQNYVLKRCLRNRQALEEHYRLSLHTSRRQKWYQYLEDRDVGNREALKALTEHMPKVTYVYMLHKITAMYIDGQLKGGFQTVKAYAEFCGKFKSWLDEMSLKLWPPRHGEVLAQDYRDALDFVNKECAPIAGERELSVHDFLNMAKRFVERLHEVWIWQNTHGTAYRKEHRSSMVVRRHECFRKYLERGNVEDYVQLRLYFERREIVSHWLKDNLWLVSLLGDSSVQSLRPPVCTTELTFPLLGADPVASLVQRFLDTGLRSDFNKIRIKISEMANMHLHGFFKKARNLQHSIYADSLRPDGFHRLEPQRLAPVALAPQAHRLYFGSPTCYPCGGVQHGGMQHDPKVATLPPRIPIPPH